VARELIEDKWPKVHKDLVKMAGGKAIEWQVTFAFFARNDFTSAARAYAKAYETLLIDLAMIAG